MNIKDNVTDNARNKIASDMVYEYCDYERRREHHFVTWRYGFGGCTKSAENKNEQRIRIVEFIHEKNGQILMRTE